MVCTGNICRSPMAEALLRAHLARRGVEVHVHSAGTLAWGGAASAHAVTVMREHGLVLDEHASRPLTRTLVERADLVLGMTREHVWAVRAHAPDAADRTYLLGEIVRLGEQVGARRPTEPTRAWLARVAAARPEGPTGRVVGRPGDEVADPVGEPLQVYRATAARLDDRLGRLAALLAP